MDWTKGAEFVTKDAIFPNVAHVLMLGERHFEILITLYMESVYSFSVILGSNLRKRHVQEEGRLQDDIYAQAS